MPKWWRNSQEDIDRIHEENLRDLARRRQEDHDRYQRNEDFKRWRHEQEQGAPSNTPLSPPPRKRGR